MASRHPLFGLPHKVDVVQRKKVDDGFGGVKLSDGTVIYSKRRCRVSLRDDSNQFMETQRGSGYDAEKKIQVVMEYSPKVKENFFLRIPWGVPPNLVPVLSLPGSFPPSVIITTPAGSKTLSWSDTSSRYEDSNSEYTVTWTGTVWQFKDTVAPLTHDFTGFSQSQNIFKRPWDEEVGASYAVTSQTGPTQDHRIMWKKHHFDQPGHKHHTEMYVEIENVDE